MADESRSLILIVEDDPGVATLQRRRLERADFRVEVATDVTAAMAVLAHGGVGLVVMDYRLGSTTGLDLHRHMKATGYDVPVIMVSASTDDAMVIEAMRAGIRDFVVKTSDYLEYLPDAVRGILNQAAAETAPVRHERRRARVLIVEDDRGVASLERRQLEQAGYEVEVATTIDEALATLRGGDMSLAVIDLNLGGGASGLDLYERMKADGFDIPAILVTAYPDEQVSIRALRAGIRDYIPRSNDYLEYLPTAVDRIVTQVRVERRLIESELRLASIIGTTLDAIVMCDERLEIVLFNLSAEQLFGYRAGDALGQPLDRFMPGLDLMTHASGPAVQQAARMQRRLELDGVRRSGEHVPIEVSINEVIVHGKRLFTVIARDISERRRIEAELRDADRRKDEFLGMLAHELRNPLAAIMNAGEVLDRTLADARASRLTAVVKRQARALARMVDDLLDVSRVTLGKIRITKEPILLQELVTRVTDIARETAVKAQQTLEVRLDPTPAPIDGDATRLEQVLSNLLNNAMKFTPPGGRITVTAGLETNEAVVRISDTGIGIEPSLLTKVFDLFVQAETSLDRSKSGLGIGLALVRQVVGLHGGSVKAFSEGVGKGSEFVVRLPAAPLARARRQEQVVEPLDGGKQMHVVVVDDQPDTADGVALLIETFGHEARALYDGASALALTDTESPDLMFIDIGMPDMTGYELARQIRSRPGLAHVRLIALTGYGREEDRARAIEAGFDLHLTKPVTDTTLQTILSDFAPARNGKTRR
jgi:PAS domain S-box-containing protein